MKVYEKHELKQHTKENTVIYPCVIKKKYGIMSVASDLCGAVSGCPILTIKNNKAYTISCDMCPFKAYQYQTFKPTKAYSIINTCNISTSDIRMAILTETYTIMDIEKITK